MAEFSVTIAGIQKIADEIQLQRYMLNKADAVIEAVEHGLMPKSMPEEKILVSLKELQYQVRRERAMAGSMERTAQEIISVYKMTEKRVQKKIVITGIIYIEKISKKRLLKQSGEY